MYIPFEVFVYVDTNIFSDLYSIDRFTINVNIYVTGKYLFKSLISTNEHKFTLCNINTKSV